MTNSYGLFILTFIICLPILITGTAHAKLEAAAASPNSITLTWTAPGDDGASGQASQYDIRYSTSTINDLNWNSATQVADEPTPQVAGSIESFVVTGLNPSTTYYFAIKVADEVPNWSALSNIISKSTDSETTPPSNISNLLITNVGETVLDLGWTAVGDDGTTGTASQYDIRYYTDSITDSNWDLATQVLSEPTPQSAGSSESMTITGLSGNTKYYFAIKVADEVPNWSGLSNIPSVTTSNETTSPAAVSNLLASNATGNSIQLTWTAPGDDGNSGTATAYDIRLSTSNINSGTFNSATIISNLPTPKAAGQPETLIVSGLDQEVTYYFALKTVDEAANWSDLSNVVNATTVDETPPNAINDLQVETGSLTGSISLNWTAPGDDDFNGVASLYEIRYSQSEIDESNWLSSSLFLAPPVPANSGETEGVTISNLNPGEIYYVAIKAYDDMGNISTMSNVDSGEAFINISTGIDDDENQLPTSFNLAQNYPNPFNPSTSIQFSLPSRSNIELSVYNIYGQKVKTLARGSFEAGEHQVEWNGTADNGRAVSTGVYVYKINSNEFNQSKKMVLMK